MAKRYANLGGDSNVSTYDISRGKVVVEFEDGSHYLYTNTSAGRYAMSRMRSLAEQGQGLNSFINHSVGQGYERKW